MYPGIFSKILFSLCWSEFLFFFSFAEKIILVTKTLQKNVPELTQIYPNISQALTALSETENETDLVLYINDSMNYLLFENMKIAGKNVKIMPLTDSNKNNNIEPDIYIRSSSLIFKDAAELVISGISFVISESFANVIRIDNVGRILFQGCTFTFEPSDNVDDILLIIGHSNVTFNQVIFKTAALSQNIFLRGVIKIESAENIYIESVLAKDFFAPVASLLKMQLDQKLVITNFSIFNSILESALQIWLPAFSNFSSLALQGNTFIKNAFDVFNLATDSCLTINKLNFDNNHFQVSAIRISKSNKVKIFFNSFQVIGNTIKEEMLLCLGDEQSIYNLSESVFGSNKGKALIFVMDMKELTLYNVKFLSNGQNTDLRNIDNLYGPCVYSENVFKAALLFCEFNENQANHLVAGALFIQNEDFLGVLQSQILIIDKCHFQGMFSYLISKNTDDVYGTSLFISTEGDIFINRTEFKQNNMYMMEEHESGPCLTVITPAKLYLTFTVFEANHGTFSSNCLFFRGYLINIEESTFFGNTIYGIDQIIGDYKAPINSYTTGGSLASSANIISFNKVIISSNSAHDGGGFFLFIKQAFLLHKVTLINLIVENNTAIYKGGGFAIDNFNRVSFIDVQVISSIFRSNLGKIEAGVAYSHCIMVQASLIIFKECLFDLNRARRGGVFYDSMLSGFVKYENSNFTNNSVYGSDYGGGVFYFVSDHTTALLYCIFINNTAKLRGGVGQGILGTLTDVGSIYINNSAEVDGGIYVLQMIMSINLINIKINGGYAKVQGGAFVLMQQGKLTLDSITVSNIRAKKGAIVSTMQEAVLLITNLNISRCKADYGLVVYSLNSLEKILISKVVVGESSVSFGTFYFLYSDVYIKNLLLINHEGSLIYSRDSFILLNQAEFRNTTCYTSGAEGCLIEAHFTLVEFDSVNLNIFSLFGVDTTLMLLRDCNINFNILSLNQVKTERIEALMSAYRCNIIMKQIFMRKFNNIGSVFRSSNVYIDQIFADNTIADIDLAPFNTVESSKEQSSFICFGLFLCEDCLNLSIANSNIKNFNVQGLKGVISLNSKTLASTVRISNSSFNNITGKFGSVIHIENNLVRVFDSVFTNNKAENFGACIYLNCSDFTKCSLLLIKNIFHNNVANLAGGAIYWQGKEPVVEDNNIFNGNLAPSGVNTASSAVKIILVEGPLGGNYASGQKIKDTFLFAILDAYNQECLYLNEGYGSLRSENAKPEFEISIIGNKLSQIKKGRFKFESLTLIAPPNTSRELLIELDMIPHFSIYTKSMPTPDQDNFHRNTSEGGYRFAVPVYFRNCIRGEIYRPDEEICLSCPRGFYSFNPQVERCYDCPENQQCRGGDDIYLEKGFWKQNHTSVKIYPCNVLRDSCIGGSGDYFCAEGYEGVLCGSCIYNETAKYYKNGFALCRQCTEGQSYSTLILFVLFIVVLFVHVVFTIKESLRTKTINHAISISLLIDLFINYIESIVLITNISIPWPYFFYSISQYGEFLFNLDNITGVIICPLSEIAFSVGIKLYSALIVSGTCFLIFVLTSGIYIWLIVMLLKRKWDPYYKSKILISIISLYKILIQPMIEFYLRSFQCFEIEDVSYLKSQSSMECWTGEHQKLALYFILPCVTLIILFPVLLSLYYLIKNRKRLNTPSVVQKIWLLVLGYRPGFFFWEYVVLLRKALLIFFSVLFTDPLISALVLMFVILQYSIFQLSFEPYVSKQLNTLDVIQNVATFITFSSSLFLNAETSRELQIIIIMAVVFVNLIFFFYWFHLFLPEFRTLVRLVKSNTKKALFAFRSRLSSVKRNTELRIRASDSHKLSQTDSRNSIKKSPQKFPSEKDEVH